MASTKVLRLNEGIRNVLIAAKMEKDTDFEEQ